MAKNKVNLYSLRFGLSADDTLELMKAFEKMPYIDHLNSFVKDTSLSAYWIGFYSCKIRELYYKGRISLHIYNIIDTYLYYECF